MASIYYESDIKEDLIKDQQIAVLGFGNQGSAHALNLRDSGYQVIVGLRPESTHQQKAREWGLQTMSISEAVKNSKIVVVLIPDEIQKNVYADQIEPHMTKGKALCFSHGFNISYKTPLKP